MTQTKTRKPVKLGDLSFTNRVHPREHKSWRKEENKPHGKARNFTVWRCWAFELFQLKRE